MSIAFSKPSATKDTHSFGILHSLWILRDRLLVDENCNTNIYFDRANPKAIIINEKDKWSENIAPIIISMISGYSVALLIINGMFSIFPSRLCAPPLCRTRLTVELHTSSSPTRVANYRLAGGSLVQLVKHSWMKGHCDVVLGDTLRVSDKLKISCYWSMEWTGGIIAMSRFSIWFWSRWLAVWNPSLSLSISLLLSKHISLSYFLEHFRGPRKSRMTVDIRTILNFAELYRNKEEIWWFISRWVFFKLISFICFWSKISDKYST